MKVSIIGAGFSGLAAASTLAAAGFEVHVFEKHNIAGGRARKFNADGFHFDMGPSWYWMPDIFESFFQRFGKSASNFYTLKRLDPSYRVYFGKNDYIDVPANPDKIYELFESLEAGSAKKLDKFLENATYKYNFGMKELVYRPSKSVTEFFELPLLKALFNLDFFKSVSSTVRGLFKDPRLVQILEFPVLFLGATSQNTPALYTLMNHADFNLGTWYPIGGIYKVVEAFEYVAKSQGVRFHYSSNVESLGIINGRVKNVIAGGKEFKTDYLVGSADYNFIDTVLLPPDYRSYSAEYWNKRKLAPSAILIYLGINKKLKNLLHHNLFFDEDFEQHAHNIYEKPAWPDKPALYVNCSSVTDGSVAPEGSENVIILIPVAPGLNDTESIRKYYYDLAINRIEKITGQSFEKNIFFSRIYSQRNFIEDYNSLKGNAYGLANTLDQTAIFKPRIQSKKLENLFFAGQLTVPGPGVPPAIISGQVAAGEIIKHSKH